MLTAKRCPCWMRRPGRCGWRIRPDSRGEADLPISTSAPAIASRCTFLDSQVIASAVAANAAGWWSYGVRLTDGVPAQYFNPLSLTGGLA